MADNLDRAIQEDVSLYYQIKQKKRFYLIQLSREMPKELENYFYIELGEIIVKAVDVVVDCFLVEDITSNTLLALKIMQQQLNSVQKQVEFINTNKFMATKIQRFIFGKDKDFIPTDLYSALMTITEQKSVETNFTLIKSLVLATARTLFVQSHITCGRKKTYFKKDNRNEFLGTISGIITIETDNFAYIFAISFPESTYLYSISKFLDEEYVEINDENRDGVAEILNIIIGHTKTLLTKKDGQMKISLPTVHLGKQYPADVILQNETVSYSNARVLAIPFSSEIGRFYLELVFPQQYSMESINELIMT